MMPATIKAITASSKLPSKANLIELRLIQTPKRDKIFGKISLKNYVKNIVSSKN